MGSATRSSMKTKPTSRAMPAPIMVITKGLDQPMFEVP